MRDDTSTDLAVIHRQRRRLLRVVAATSLTTLVAVLLALAAASSPRAAASPEPGEIVFTRHLRGTGQADVFVVIADGSRVRRLTRDGRSGQAVFSPDSRRIVFVSGRDGRAAAPELYVMDAGGRNVRRLTRSERAPRSFWQNTSPAWSPDGRTIVFVRTWIRGGRETTDLWRVAADGRTRPVRLTKHAGREANPTFTPEGYVGFARDGWIRLISPRLGVVNVRPGSRPAWSPDRTYLAYEREDGIYLTLGQGERLIVPGGSWPSWSPDGSKLAYRAADGALETIVVLGRGTTRLTAAARRTEDLSPSWRR